MKITGTIIALFMVILSGCISIKKELAYSSCTNEDWKALGYKAAQSGTKVRAFDAVKKDCGTDLNSNAQDLFVDGYSDGLIAYCTFEQGYKHGTDGLGASHVCHQDVGVDYKKGYTAGNRKRKSMESFISREQRELDNHNISQGESREGPF
ncbi:DUF2799 domain-containing protein [Pseudoalteromonas luteoviolacea]|uniref:Lipoprotein n=1 Tax=Pseudoalteromonas luteoviolacea H33 TaxID=1365251 RepID=A0A161XYV0_9GAMM|nr:DUF2799 domain-containing protein [Pseudoalteromonas luteoviolacea]KZN48539.1 hypothetical protein N476_21945 [Pseudoalteromonas luteoviolacea H33]KZN73400.1 hypothetical protein N477_24045 [Pseudoalteromonas luteoviolacea H33-S]MBQ4876492.1 DUF2799 domain-containing protein [Pseudoalteromonas luteoviolacea]MBQ4905123.1 DUF2799 domain-containing protein [Pseudoalteromonas luteoviolacea]